MANSASPATTGSDSVMAANRVATDSAVVDSVAIGPAGADRATRDCRAAGHQTLAVTANLRASLEAGWLAVAARVSTDHAAGPLVGSAVGSVVGLASRDWLAAAMMMTAGSATRETARGIARARSTDSAWRIRAGVGPATASGHSRSARLGSRWLADSSVVMMARWCGVAGRMARTRQASGRCLPYQWETMARPSAPGQRAVPR